MSFLGLFGGGSSSNSQSEYGDESAATQEITYSGIAEDIKAAGGKIPEDLKLLLETGVQAKSTAPVDDKKLVMERLIGLVASLPQNSANRKKLTSTIIDTLWDSLQHPPLSYVGDKYQYRQPDGSHNNIMYPDLGKAGTEYARTVRQDKKLYGAKPDPSLLFDLLMARGGNFKQNPAGISSVLFYHASIIIHDVFHTDRNNFAISQASSYLDLAPLYGNNQTEQNAIRTMQDGLIKPDTFSDKRLLGLPPGICVLLVMYSRFHNYAAKTIKAINENGRFSLPRSHDTDAPDVQKANLVKQDNDLFQTARLITNGLYINISLHDYIRGIANLNHSESTWTLDPRLEIDKTFDGVGTPRGVGNQVSCEFNLLYRFHSGVSKRDDAWTRDFFGKIFPGQDPTTIGAPQLLQGLKAFESTIPEETSKRTFGGLKRTGADGTGAFNDDDLVKILKESIEDPAGAFGANTVPEILKPIEVLGILQARKWQVASLNEFRGFFNLKKHKTFEDINPDPYVANTLRKLYDHPDMVEMYPGMFLEDTKPRMDPGMGLCAPYTVTRAVFSDAVTLVRSDRHLTLDYTPANLTNWGITEVAQDYDTLGGSKMYHLILNAFPSYFKYNSVYAMQPFYTPTESRKIFDKFGKSSLYSFDPPAKIAPPIPILTHAGLKRVLNDQKNFKVPWGESMEALNNEHDFMLAGDLSSNTEQRNLVGDAIYDVTGSRKQFKDYTEEITLKLLKREVYQLGKVPFNQVDIVRDIGNLTCLHFAAALLYLPLKTDDNPNGQYSEAELYKTLTDLTWFVFSDSDPTKSFEHRREAKKSIDKLGGVMVEEIKKFKTPVGIWDKLTGGAGVRPPPPSLKDYGSNLVKRLLSSGRSVEDVAWMLLWSGCAFVANSACAFAQLIDFYLQDDNRKHWSEIQRLATLNTPEADKLLTKYTLEGTRLSNSLGIFRNVDPVDSQTITINQLGQDVVLKKNDKVFVSFVYASKDASVFPDPLEIKLDRPTELYITHGEGQHQCLGKDINIIQNTYMLKSLAKLRNFRRAPGDEGKLKFIPKPGGIKLYMNADWSKFTPYPTTMRVQFDGPIVA